VFDDNDLGLRILNEMGIPLEISVNLPGLDSSFMPKFVEQSAVFSGVSNVFPHLERNHLIPRAADLRRGVGKFL
jgi:hypothetical protein